MYHSKLRSICMKAASPIYSWQSFPTKHPRESVFQDLQTAIPSFNQFWKSTETFYRKSICSLSILFLCISMSRRSPSLAILVLQMKSVSSSICQSDFSKWSGGWLHFFQLFSHFLPLFMVYCHSFQGTTFITLVLTTHISISLSFQRASNPYAKPCLFNFSITGILYASLGCCQNWSDATADWLWSPFYVTMGQKTSSCVANKREFRSRASFPSFSDGWKRAAEDAFSNITF